MARGRHREMDRKPQVGLGLTDEPHGKPRRACGGRDSEFCQCVQRWQIRMRRRLSRHCGASRTARAHNPLQARFAVHRAAACQRPSRAGLGVVLFPSPPQPAQSGSRRFSGRPQWRSLKPSVKVRDFDRGPQAHGPVLGSAARPERSVWLSASCARGREFARCVRSAGRNRTAPEFHG